jgi:hypothetical protein
MFNLSASLFEPPDATVFLKVEFGHIGFDVQERRCVEDINIFDLQKALSLFSLP